MSLKEKVGQMTQITLDVILEGEMFKAVLPHRLDQEAIKSAIHNYHIGSILNTPGIALSREDWIELIQQIQEEALNHTPNKIPVLYGIDSIHGATYTLDSTLFPQSINMAAARSPELVKAAASITAYETRASAIPWCFSPVLDLGRLQTWPRLWETFGEDIYLATTMGLAMVDGLQEDELSHPYKVASCLKHFLGYSQPLNGNDRTPAWISDRFLRAYFLPPFEAAIKAGAATIMVNSGEINGIPVHVNKYILHDLLREELGFQGLVVTDWEDIKYLHTRHKVASSHKEAVYLAITAGIDMSMVPDDLSFCDHLIELVEEGRISEERINTSVERILTLKQQLGLFKNPTIDVDADYQLFGSEKHSEYALQAAQESIVLLKNDNNNLPIESDKKVLVTGPTADSMSCMNGGWTVTWQGEKADEFIKNKPSVLKAIQSKIGEAQVAYSPGCTFDEVLDIEKTIELAANCDHILLCLGEPSYCEFHGNIDDLTITKAQSELASALVKTGKPITLILLQGRPRIITHFADHMNAILYAGLPGNEGGKATADIIFGDVNPSAKLPITYPKYVNGLVTYDHKYSEASSIQNSKICYDPLFEFGDGLSYTDFEYSNLKLSAHQISMEDKLEVSISVTNTGQRKGKEVVELYLRDDYASITPPVRQLKAFKKIELDISESQTIHFELSKSDFSFVGIEHKWICEPGTFKVFIKNCAASFEII